VLTGDGKVLIETPRDREGSFEPLRFPPSRAQSPKHARRFTAFDDSIVALYARGLTVREIQGYLVETYGSEVSPQLISTVTDGVLGEVTAWQSRPLEAVYPVQHSSNIDPTLRVGVCQAYRMRRWCLEPALGRPSTRGRVDPRDALRVRSGRTMGGATRRCIWRWGCAGTARGRFSVCGSRPRKVPNSG
jgi:hypothetical protein